MEALEVPLHLGLFLLGRGPGSVLDAQKFMDVSENRGIPKSSILMGFSIIDHSFWGTPIFGNTHIYIYT